MFNISNCSVVFSLGSSGSVCRICFKAGINVVNVKYVLWTEKQTLSQPVLLGLPSTDDGANGTKKLLLNTQVNEDFA